MSHQGEPCSPESVNATVLQQAIQGAHRDPSPSFRSEHVYVDPKTALGHPTPASFGYGVLANSSQNSYHEQGEHLEGFEGFETSANNLDGLGFSPCEGDAQEDHDDSFTSQHSFWTNHPGDTTASTVDTVDLDDTPVPLLSRDGRWKGGTSPSKVAAYYGHHDQSQRPESASRPEYSLYHGDRIEEALISRGSPYQGTRLRRATADMDIHAGPSFDSVEEKKDTQQDDVQKEGSTSSNRAESSERPGKKQAKRSKSSKKARTSRTFSSDEPRHASSEAGTPSFARTFSSPASSLGRYRLRRKESVPVLSLSDLLTPPPNKPTSSSDEAVDGSADWHDEHDRDAVHPVQHNHDTRSRRQRYAQVEPEEDEEEKYTQDPAIGGGTQVEPEEDEEEKCTQDPAIGGGSGEVVLEEGELIDTEPKVEVEEAVKDEPEDAFQLPPTRYRGTRTFPRDWEIHPAFPLLYQRYSVPSSVSREVLEMLLRRVNYAYVDHYFNEIVDRAQRSHGAYNKPRSILDLYTPRFVKGVGAQKVGMCPICYEDGKVKFLKTKFSAYNYHLQNFHGVSAFTGLPFTPPMHFRAKMRTNVKPNERFQIVQGLCHCCNKYIDMQGLKETEIKVPEIYWWKHAQACHRKGKTPEGVGGYFVEDTWFERVCSVLQLIDGYDSEIAKLLSDHK